MEEFKNSQKKVNSILQKEIDVLSNNNLNLKEMLQYSLKGGKRIRPIIAFEIFNSLQTKTTTQNETNLSCILFFLEFLHSASLILDDLPCMDNDELRRGIPTFHKKYDVKMAYIVANFMIGKACKMLVRQINSDSILNSTIKSYVISEIFDYNFLTSLGQIKDLDKDDTRQSIFMNKIVNKLTSNTFIKELFNRIELTENQFEKVLWLNMKTYPLFYLSFLLPNIFFHESTTSNDLKNLVINVEYIALCFSIMFQICDDLEDREKDFKLDKVNSHLKIIPTKSIFVLYSTCKELYVNRLNKLNNLGENKVLKYFVEMLDKKIETYDNGECKEGYE